MKYKSRFNQDMEENNRNTITGVRMLKQSLIALSLFSLTACLGGGGGGGGSKNLGPLMDSKFVDAPVQGLQYYQDGEQTRYKLTGPNGEFECNVGSKVTFSLRSGYTDIGSVICGSSVVFPMDLDVSRSPASERADIPKFVALLLHFMDEDFKGTNFADITNKGRIEIDTNFISAADIDVDMDDNTLTVERILGVIATIKVLRTRKCDDLMDEDWTDCYISEVGEAYSIDSNGDYSANLVNALAEIDLHLAQSCATYGDGTSSCRSYTEGDNDEEGDENGDGDGSVVSTIPVATLSEIANHIRSSDDRIYDGVDTVCLNFSSSSDKLYLYTGSVGYIGATIQACTTESVSDIVKVKRNGSLEEVLNFAFDNYFHIDAISSGVVSLTGDVQPDRSYEELKGSFFKVDDSVQWYQSCNTNHDNFWSSADTKFSDSFVTATCTNIQDFAWNL